jgi:hypothetical protein
VINNKLVDLTLGIFMAAAVTTASSSEKQNSMVAKFPGAAPCQDLVAGSFELLDPNPGPGQTRILTAVDGTKLSYQVSADGKAVRKWAASGDNTAPPARVAALGLQTPGETTVFYLPGKGAQQGRHFAADAMLTGIQFCYLPPSDNQPLIPRCRTGCRNDPSTRDEIPALHISAPASVSSKRPDLCACGSESPVEEIDAQCDPDGDNNCEYAFCYIQGGRRICVK